jgi:hypothetical protein
MFGQPLHPAVFALRFFGLWLKSIHRLGSSGNGKQDIFETTKLVEMNDATMCSEIPHFFWINVNPRLKHVKPC